MRLEILRSNQCATRFLKKHVTFLPRNSLSSTGERIIMDWICDMMPEELDSLKGVTITGWEIIDIDYGKPFIALKTNKKFEDNETVYLIVSQDAELNGGGFVSFMDLKGAKGLNY